MPTIFRVHYVVEATALVDVTPEMQTLWDRYRELWVESTNPKLPRKRRLEIQERALERWRKCRELITNALRMHGDVEVRDFDIGQMEVIFEKKKS